MTMLTITARQLIDCRTENQSLNYGDLWKHIGNKYRGTKKNDLVPMSEILPHVSFSAAAFIIRQIEGFEREKAQFVFWVIEELQKGVVVIDINEKIKLYRDEFLNSEVPATSMQLKVDCRYTDQIKALLSKLKYGINSVINEFQAINPDHSWHTLLVDREAYSNKMIELFATE